MSFASTYSALSARGLSSIGNIFGLIQTIAPPAYPTNSDILFGLDMDMSYNGNIVIVGAINARQTINQQGALFLLTKSGSTFSSSLFANAPTHVGNFSLNFGTTVSISGDANYIVAGPGGSATRIGYAVIYDQTISANTVLYGTPNVAGTNFGSLVAMSNSGNYLAICQTNLVTIYNRSGTTWNSHSNISISGLPASVDLDENANICIIGMYTGINPGNVTIYSRSNTTWTLSQTISANDDITVNNFGTEAVINPTGNIITVSAPLADIGAIANAGAIYKFVYSGNTWTQTNKLYTIDSTTDDRLGSSKNLAMSGGSDTIIAGSINANAAYIFELSNNTYVQTQKTTITGSVQYGRAIVTNNLANILLVGDIQANTNNGRVYNYSL